MRSVVVRLAGAPGCGKTHMLATFPAPLAIFDYDGGVVDIIPKFPDKEIKVYDLRLPIQWSSKKKTYGKEEWAFFLDAYEKALDSYKTIGIDTGTSMWGLVRAAYSEEVGKMLLTYMYGEPNARMGAIVQWAKEAGVNLVLTHHVRRIYVDEKATGEMESDGWSHLGDLVDWSLMMQLVKDKSGDVYTEGVIDKCRLDRSLTWQSLIDPSYEKLEALVG